MFVCVVEPTYIRSELKILCWIDPLSKRPIVTIIYIIVTSFNSRLRPPTRIHNIDNVAQRIFKIVQQFLGANLRCIFFYRYITLDHPQLWNSNSVRQLQGFRMAGQLYSSTKGTFFYRFQKRRFTNRMYVFVCLLHCEANG